jgi:hypothetical protein
MIGFIGTSITITLNYNQLRQVTINDCDSFHSLLDYERLLFPCDWLGSDLRVGHFFSFRCPLVNTPQMNTQLNYWTMELLFEFSYDWTIELSNQVKSKSNLYYDRRSIGQSLSGSSSHLGLTIRFLLLSDSCGFVDMVHSLWREDGPTLYNCCWPLPEQSFKGPSSAGLVTIFYCLRLVTPLTWRARSPYLYPPGTEWPNYTPRQLVPFSSPPTTILEPIMCPPVITSRRTEYRSPSPTLRLPLSAHSSRIRVFCEPLSSNGPFQISGVVSQH